MDTYITKSLRPAWLEIDLNQLKKNMDLIIDDMKVQPNERLKFTSVVKDQAYGHGAVKIAGVIKRYNPEFFAVATIDEALELRKFYPDINIFLFGERPINQWKICLENDFTIFIHDLKLLEEYRRLSERFNKKARIIVEIDTGLSRYGFRWDRASEILSYMFSEKRIKIHSLMSHFAMSDELDKTFANKQLSRFHHLINKIESFEGNPCFYHMCNSGGYLDLPNAHFDMVRIGILPLGVFPSSVCRRIQGLTPIMSLKAKIAYIREIEKGDHVGYGMRFTADKKMTIAVIPVGYGDGYPRVRNEGWVLIKGVKAPIIGGNAMDVMMVDISHIPGVQLWEETVLLGCQGKEEITVHDLAKLKNTVSYDVMNNFNRRLPRIYIE